MCTVLYLMSHYTTQSVDDQAELSPMQLRERLALMRVAAAEEEERRSPQQSRSDGYY